MQFIPYKTQIDYSRLQNSELSFDKKANKKPIFHYTSIGGLEGILGYKKLRFTNIKYMNDKEEIIAGLNSFVKFYNFSEGVIEKIYYDFINNGMQTFVCCFSLEKDSLPMWNYYTKEINNQGYNIEFNYKKLVESILRSNPFLNECSIFYGIVDYSKNDYSKYNRIIKNKILNPFTLGIYEFFLYIMKDELNDKSSDIYETELKNLEKTIKDIEKNSNLNNFPIYFYNAEKCSFEKGVFMEYLYFIKQDYFKQEREFRIVITVPNERLIELKEKGVYKFRIGNGILIPFLELSFSLDAVKSITISPTVHSDLVKSSIQDFLKYCKFEIEDYSSFIKSSNIPVRF